jgi:hypothetical protein
MHTAAGSGALWALAGAALVAAVLVAAAASGTGSVAAPSRRDETEATPVEVTATGTYSDRRYGFSVTYPSEFALDRATLPRDGGSAEFWTADGRAGFTVYAAETTAPQTVSGLLAQARAAIAGQGGGVVTYVRIGDDWFVISGITDRRIVYQRTVLARGGRLAATLYVNYPESAKPRWDAAVSLMSHSFGFQTGRPSPTLGMRRSDPRSRSSAHQRR